MIKIYCKKCGKLMETLKQNDPKEILQYEICFSCLPSNFTKQVHQEAVEFRKRKMKEIFEKEKPTEVDLVILKSWGVMFEND